MLFRKYLGCVIALILTVGTVAGASQQGSYDLEDVNFPLDKKGVVDAAPQIQRLANMLNAHPELRLTIKGHADWQGPGPYNKRLSLERAEAVKGTLVEKGVGAERIAVEGYGETLPATSNESREGRWVNRRVVFDVYRMVDGVPDYFYRDNRFIKGLEEPPTVVIGPDVTIPDSGSTPPTGMDSNRIMDRLGDIEKNLDALRAELKAPVPGETPTPVPPRMPRLFPEDVRGLLAGSFGPDTDGHLAGRVEGRIFWPFSDVLAVQAGMTGLLSKDRDEYRFDLGLVGKYDAFQAGLFVQALSADIDGMQDTGTLSQIAMTLGYQTGYGIVSAYATHPIKKEDVVRVDRRFIGSDVETTETYLRVRKTYGIAADLAFDNCWYMEGSLGWISAADNADLTGHLQIGRLIGMGNLSAFIRGEFNNGRLVDDNDGRVLAGLEWGTWRARSPESTSVVAPMVLPALNYEVKVRTSMLYNNVNFAPVVAIDVSTVKGEVPLTVEFHGTAHDPDGTVESLRWDFADGTTAQGNNVTHTFQQAGSYRVVLTATDNKGVSGQAEVVITAGHNSVPVVSIDVSTIEGAPPLEVDFRGIASDTDGTVESYEWDFGDGSSATGQNVTHTFQNAGLYRVVLTATDNQGGQGRADVTITVGRSGGGNTPPVADAGRDGMLGFEPDLVGPLCLDRPDVCEVLKLTPERNVIALDGTLSVDVDGDPLTYRWEQVGGPTGVLERTDTAATTFLVPVNAEGVYTFRLIVTDGRGGIDSDTVTVVVDFLWGR